MPTWYDKATADTLLAGKASTSALTALAPLASPAFTGTPTIGGATVAKTTDIAAAISNLVGAAPSALDTLKEIDDQLTADEGAAAALAAAVAVKAPLASPAFTGTPTIGGVAVAKTTDVTAAVANAASTTRRALVDAPVSWRTWTTGGPFWITDQPGTSKSAHWAPADIGDLRLVYGNWVSGANQFGDIDNDSASPLPLRAAIEYPSNVINPVFFNGARTVNMESGATVTSDPLGIDIPAGEQFWVRTYLNPAAGQKWPTNGNTSGNTEFEGFTTGDQTGLDAGGVPRSDSGIIRPFVIRGRSAITRSVAIVGDSIAAGQGDGDMGFSNGAHGFIARALESAKLPYTSIALPGELTSRFALPIFPSSGAHRRRIPLVAGCTHAVCEFGVNDLGSALNPQATFTTLSASLLRVWRLLTARGIKVLQTTITPVSSSTDNWATVGSQTTQVTNPARTAVNDWIRAGAPLGADGSPVAVGTTGALLAGSAGHPLAGYFEIADLVESARNSGLWKANLTGDGVHPVQAAHIAMSAGIDSTKFS